MLLNQILIISIFSNQSISIKILIQILILINIRCSGLGKFPQGGTSRVSSLPQQVYRAHGEVDGDASPKDQTRAVSGHGCPQGQSCNQEAAWHLTGQWQTIPCTDRERESKRVRMVGGSNGLSSICPHGSNGESHGPSRAENMQDRMNNIEGALTMIVSQLQSLGLQQISPSCQQ